MDKYVVDDETENGLGFPDMESLRAYCGCSLRPFNENTKQHFKISVVFPTPKPTPSTLLKSVARDGRVKDSKGNWVFAWQELDAFHDDENGTKEENEQAFLTSTLLKNKENKLTALEDLALEKEEAGIEVAGVEISTTRKDQSRMTTALNLMGRKPQATKRFKAKNGWFTVDKQTLEDMQDALEAHRDLISATHEAHEIAINLLEVQHMKHMK